MTGDVAPGGATSPNWTVPGLSLLMVGFTGTGSMAITDGGTVTNGSGYVGWDSVADGTVTVSGTDGSGNASTWTNANVLQIGFLGRGTLIVTGGGKVHDATGTLGSLGEGIATVAGAGSVWSSTGGLTIGDAGTGTATISDGGRVDTSVLTLAAASTSTGTLNIGAVAGQTAVGAGVLDAGAVAFGDGAARLVFNHDGAVTFAAALASTGAGLHAIDHYAGTTTLTGDGSGFSGTTTVSGGTLVVANALGGAAGVAGGALVVNGTLAGPVTVGAGGLLGGTGTLGAPGSAVTVAAGGVHAPDNSIGVQTIAGDYVNHGTLRIEAAPADADRVVVAGAVDITGATLDLVLAPAGAAGWNILNGPFVIIDKQGTGTVTGTFGTVARNLLFLDALLDYAGGDGNDVTLELSRNDLAFAGVGRTRNQRAAGGAIDTLGGASPVWRAIALANDPGIVRAGFDALSGEVHASAKTALVEDSRFVRDAIDGRLRAAFDGAAASPAPVLAYGPDAAPVAVVPDHAGAAFWGHAFGSWGHRDSDGNAARLDRSAGGLLAGADAPAPGNWRFGAVAGYSRSAFAAPGRASSGWSNTYHFGLYGGTTWNLAGGDLAFRAGAAYSWSDVATSRNVAFPGLADTLTARYGAGTTQVFGELAYGMRAGGLAFEPFANLAYVNLHTNGFTEKGKGAALTSGPADTDAAFTTLGLRASTRFSLGAAAATLKGMLGWRHAFGNVTPNAAMRFAAGGNAFAIAGAPIARDAALVEAGLDLALSPAATLGVAYSGQFGSGTADQSVRATFNMKF